MPKVRSIGNAHSAKRCVKALGGKRIADKAGKLFSQ
jgi:hypothetical protein